MLKKINLLYQFSRPHTIIGSFISITTLYLIVNHFPKSGLHWLQYLTLIISCLCCNIFITGLNQIIDVDIDKISKPFLPIAAGQLSITNAKKIIFTALGICMVTSAALSLYLFALILFITIIGIMYSVPPIRLKNHHLPAALSITIVRGILVNMGIGLWLQYFYFSNLTIPIVLWPLTIFVVAFSIAIAWLKDIHDVEGDTAFKVKTLAILYSPKTAFIFSNILVAAAYVFCIAFTYKQFKFLCIAHIILLAFYSLHVFTSSLKTSATIHKFYMGFWVFFFAEYILFGINVLV